MIIDSSFSAGQLYCQLRSRNAKSRSRKTALALVPNDRKTRCRVSLANHLIRLGNVTALPVFNYEHLPARCIRIFELQPGERSEAFQGRFIISSIDEEVHYDALSYMWAEAAPVDRVVVDGATIPVAWNLARALDYLRDQQGSEPRRIWIDAICINQNDEIERGHQVAMMRSVYSKADCVRIWIDAPDLEEESEAVVALKSFQFRADEPDNNLGLGVDIEFWEPLRPIFSSEYWNRLWVQQEIANAQQISLHCGNVHIPGKILTQLRTAVNRASRSLASFPSDWYHMFHLFDRGSFADMFLVQKNSIEALSLSDRLIDLLDLAYRLQGSRFHDRVYAIMCLASDYQEGDITVDYTKSTGQTMVRAANHHVKLHRNLRFLNDGRRNIRGEKSLQLDLVHSISTWIPRTWLGHRGVSSSLTSFQNLYEQMPEDKKAVGSSTYASDFFQEYSEDLFNSCSPHCVDVEKMRLRVQGMKVDRVQISLTGVSDDEQFGLAHFWSSTLGQHIETYMSGAGSKMPLRIVRAIAPWWPTTDYSYEDVLKAFAYLFEMGQGPETTHHFIDDSAEMTRELIKPLYDTNRAAGEALDDILDSVGMSIFTFTDRGYFGRMVTCDVRAGDEIWMVLGCSLPVVLRRQTDGTYSHMSTARIPELMDDILGHPDIQSFSTESQPGDKIGEWTIENIEII